MALSGLAAMLLALAVTMSAMHSKKRHNLKIGDIVAFRIQKSTDGLMLNLEHRHT
jgi:hypothetical protein